VPAPSARVAIAIEDCGVAYASLHAGTLVLIMGIHAALFCGLLPTL
jgi:hypothetical protein